MLTVFNFFMIVLKINYINMNNDKKNIIYKYYF